MTSPETTKKELDDFLWLAEHPEYEEKPVSIRTFINGSDYMNAKDECWEPIKDDLSELFKGYDNPGMEWEYTEAVFNEGISGGKSYKASIIITYLVYRMLILKDPHKFLHLARGSGIYFLNMSLRADQAKKVVFGEINQRVYNSPWFRERNYLPNPNVKSELQFPKSITIVPGNSKETFPLGFNLLAAIMDEAAHYAETATHDVAEEMFNALYTRIKHRFGNKGMLIMISSPRYVDDFIEKKMEEAKTNKRIYTVRKTSWDSKPKTTDYFPIGGTFEMEGYIIPNEYKTEAERNFDRFKRDIMAIPSLAIDPYFKQWALVEAAVDPQQFYPLTEDGFIKKDFRGKPGKQYYMHIDLSLTTDATGIAMCHMENGVIIIDLVMKIKAPQDREIDLAEIKSIVYGLKKMGFDIAKVTYDSFESASSIQELNKQGFNAERLSVDKDLAPYETFKEAIYTGRCKVCFYKPLLDELKRLELIKGKKVDHPPIHGGSKDCADACAGAVYNCVTSQNNFMFWFAGNKEKQQTQEDIWGRAATQTATGAELGLVRYGEGGRRQNIRQ